MHGWLAGWLLVQDMGHAEYLHLDSFCFRVAHTAGALCLAWAIPADEGDIALCQPVAVLPCASDPASLSRLHAHGPCMQPLSRLAGMR